MWSTILLITCFVGVYHALPKCNYLAYDNYFYIAVDVCIPWGVDYGTSINYTQSSRYECTSSEVPKSVSYEDGECLTNGLTSSIIISKDQSSCEFSPKTCSYVSLIYTLADQNPETNECDRYTYSQSPMVYKYPVIAECLPFAMNTKYYYRISCDDDLQFNYNLYTDKRCTTSVSDQIYSVYKDNIDGFFACFQCTSEYVQGTDNDEEDDEEDDTDNNVDDNTDDTDDNTGDNTGDNTDDNTGDNTDDNTGDNTDDNTGDNTDDNTGDNTDDNTDDNNGNNNDESVSTTVSPIITISETSPNSGHTLNNLKNAPSSSNNKSASIISIISIVVIFVFAIILFGIIVFYRRKKRAMEIVNAVAMSNNDHTIYSEEEEAQCVHANGETTPIHADTTE